MMHRLAIVLLLVTLFAVFTVIATTIFYLGLTVLDTGASAAAFVGLSMLVVIFLALEPE